MGYEATKQIGLGGLVAFVNDLIEQKYDTLVAERFYGHHEVILLGERPYVTKRVLPLYTVYFEQDGAWVQHPHYPKFDEGKFKEGTASCNRFKKMLDQYCDFTENNNKLEKEKQDHEAKMKVALQRHLTGMKEEDCW